MKKKFKEKDILRSLLNISDFINFVEAPDLILGLIIEECALLTRAKSGVILSYDENLDLDAFQVAGVLSDKEKARMSSLLNERVKGIIDKSGREKILDKGFWNRKNLQDIFKETLGKKIRDVLACPIKKKGRFLGLAIVVDKKTKDNFTGKDRENLVIMCQEASIVIENINLFKAKLQTERMAAIGQTIAGISHYVKNILQGITSGSHLLDASIKDEDITTIKEAWDVVNKNTKRISDLVLDMLYYSRERRLDKEKINPKVLIEDVIELAGSRLKEKNIKLDLSIKELPRYVMVNEKGIHRSILNLVLNAVDACDKPDSLIMLGAMFDRASQALRIVVSDNGQGISKEDADRIFLPFYTKKKGKGTGLGLAITKKVVEEHGGSIKAESELGKGATFEITIPV